jgi:hypothetical protein
MFHKVLCTAKSTLYIKKYIVDIICSVEKNETTEEAVYDVLYILYKEQ